MIRNGIHFITDKKNLILFWFFCCIFQHFITQILISEYLRAILWRILWIIDIIWTSIILIKDIYTKKINYKDTKIFLLVLFVIFTTISWLIKSPSHSPYYFFTLVTLYEQTFIFYLYAIETKIEDIKSLLKKLAFIYICFVCFYTIISLFLYFIGYTTITLPNKTIIQMFNTDNLVAHKIRYMGIWNWCTVAALDSYLAILLHLYLIDNNSNKFFHILFIILESFMIYLTDTRSTFIILVFIILSFISFLFLRKKGIKKLYFFCKISAFAIVFIFILYFLIFKSNLLFSLIKNPEETLEILSSGRFEMAKGIIISVKNDLLLGKGYCNNEFIIKNYAIQHPHNIFLALLLYTGIPGIIFFSSFLILNFKKATTKIDYILQNKIKWIFVLVICIFIESLFDICIIGAPVNIQTLFFWLCLGIISK